MKGIRSTSGRLWNPRMLKGIPWTSILAIIGVSILSVISTLILSHSDGKPTDEWPSPGLKSPFPPAVLLAVSAVLSNTLLRFALLEAQPTFWWRKAIHSRDLTLADLHHYYEHGHSVLESILAISTGKNISLMSIARILTTLAVVQGPLFQRSSSIVLDSVERRGIELEVPLSTGKLPDSFTAAAIQLASGEKATAETDEDEKMYAYQPQFSIVLQDFTRRLPIKFESKACKGSCNATVIAAGLDMDCKSETFEYDFEKETEKPIVVIYSDVLFNNHTNTIGVRTTHKPKSQTGCVGKLEFTNCTLRPAIVKYNFNMKGGVVTLQAKPRDRNDTEELISSRGTLSRRQSGDDSAVEDLSALYSSQISHSGCPPPPCNRTEVKPEDVAEEYLAFYGLMLAAEGRYDCQGLMQPSKTNFATKGRSTLPYEYISSDQKAYGTCEMTWDDPTDDMLNGIQEMMFRAAISASRDGAGKQFVNATELVSQTVYKSNFKYLLAALVVPLLAAVGTIALFYGWWELCREVSLSPIEIAKAFDAPLLKGSESNADVEKLLRQIGKKRVQYGEVVGSVLGEGSETTELIEKKTTIEKDMVECEETEAECEEAEVGEVVMRFPRLAMADPSVVRKPEPRTAYE